ncbi:DUF4148 domain-containing protein [Paraburkholderia sp. J41]|uniref:DUF4148 domain-containing protein n=1 Tax=Paraburkholderia sp. J41 TaxID=2805433 RepID=UPI002AC33708|nr:DUF4148 domain-containing protein [Paraburkholderia sp. J41]
MKSLLCLTLAAAALAAPLASFAQSTAPVTRAQVLADLIRVEKAGYDPARGNDSNYPTDIQAAEAKVAAQENQQMTNDAVGGTAQYGTSAASGRASARMPAAPACVGPASYCNVYFGS